MEIQVLDGQYYLMPHPSETPLQILQAVVNNPDFTIADTYNAGEHVDSLESFIGNCISQSTHIGLTRVRAEHVRSRPTPGGRNRYIVYRPNSQAGAQTQIPL